MPPMRKIILTGILLALIGWLGLLWLIQYTLPTLGPRWLMFFLLVLALSGTVLPAVAFFNRRFPSSPPAEASVIIRQSIWVGIYGSMLLWLQLGRVLNLALGGFLAAGFILIEFFLRLRERSRFKPRETQNE